LIKDVLYSFFTRSIIRFTKLEIKTLKVCRE